MKKIIFLLICIVLFFINGCKEANTGPDNDYTPGFSEVPFNGINIYTVIKEDDGYRNIKNWETHIKETFDIEVKLTYADNIDAFINNQTYDGLIYIKSMEQLNTLVDKGLLINLHSLDLGSWLNDFSDNRILSYSKGGSLYCIPVYKTPLCEYRYYFAEYIKGYDVSEINTVEKLAEVARHMTYNDPDGNKIDDTCAFVIDPQVSHLFIDDIYKAYGCYFTKDGCSIAYNPITDRIESLAFSENINECLLYLESLNNDNVFSFLRGYQKTYSHPGYCRINKAGSFWDTKTYTFTHSSRQNNLERKKYVFGVDFLEGLSYLLGSNDKFLFEAAYPEGAYGILRDSSNPQDLMDFLNTIDNDSSMAVSWVKGIESKDYTISKKFNSIIIEIAGGRDTGLGIDLNHKGFSLMDYDVYNNFMANYTGELRETNESRINCEELYTTPFYSYTNLYNDLLLDKIMGNLDMVDFNKLVIEPLLLKKVPAEELLANYIKYYEMCEIDDYVEEINARIND